jgi:hypothetical protein
MFKMGLYCSFGHLKHKLWPNERLPTTKIRESDLLICRRRVTYRWKALHESYNFPLDGILIEGLLAKLWGSKVVGVPTWAISGLPRQKTIWMWALWLAIEYTIRGKVVASPKSGP